MIPSLLPVTRPRLLGPGWILSGSSSTVQFPSELLTAGLFPPLTDLTGFVDGSNFVGKFDPCRQSSRNICPQSHSVVHKLRISLQEVTLIYLVMTTIGQK